jgi:hypothetical protein
MQGKDERRQHGARHGKSPQYDGKQECRSRVQADVDEVIAERGVAKETMQDPEGRMRDRVVLLRGTDFEPDAPEAVK